MAGLQDLLQYGSRRVQALPPEAPMRIKVKLALERLAVPIRVYLSRFHLREDPTAGEN